MNLYLVGTIINILLLLGAGAALIIGIFTYKREKNAGKIRIQLLVFAIASFVWAGCFGTLGFVRSYSLARILRTIGVAGVQSFLLTDFFVVSSLSGLKGKTKRTVQIIASIIMAIDFVIFTRPNVDEYYIEDGFMTWIGNECWQRSFHQVVVVLLFISMAILGVLAYRYYSLKRQKHFLVLFYIVNILFLLFSSFDTFYILEYPLPTSGFGAIACTIILCLGTSRNNAFGISASDVFEKIYDFMNDGILIFDTDRKIVFANSYIKYLINDNNFKNKSITDIFDIDKTYIDYYFDSALTEEIGGLHLKLKNSIIKCNSKLVCAKDNNNDPYCYIMSLSDITKEMNMLEELKQANDAKSHFLSSISHEIRTPINAVLGMNEMIRRESKEETILAYAANIEKSGHQLLSIINDILDLTKIESGKLEIFNSSYDVASMFFDMYFVSKERAMEKGIEIFLNVNPNLPAWLYGDEVRINQILFNLVNNGIKYTDEGFVSVECDYDEVDSDTINMIISVRDSGRGMKNANNSNLFESFARLDEKVNMSIEGMGLGLAITNSLLELMGGHIEVESVYGVGSRFTVFIPQRISNRVPIGDVNNRIKAYEENKSSYKQNLVAPNARILAVDDVEMNLMVLKEFLKNSQMTIDCVTSGKEAVKKCKENQYHLILMDHMMPEMDGIECLKAIRRTEGINSSTPVIVLTANAVVGMRDMYLSEGFNDYLSKPIDGDKLEAAIKNLLPAEFISVRDDAVLYREKQD